jgi:hypothetical protein
MRTKSPRGWLASGVLAGLLAASGCDDPSMMPDTATPDAPSLDTPSLDTGDAGEPTDDAPFDVGDVLRDAPPDAPTISDTDMDGIDDAIETACGTDPSDDASLPDSAVLRGEGTSGDPYRLCFGAHLALFAALGDVSSAHARLGRDLDMTGVTAPSIGTSVAAYVGTFDGDGHAIENLVGDLPLFFIVGEGAEIRDLHISVAGPVPGSPLVANNAGRIAEVHVEANLVGNDHRGLLADFHNLGGVIEDCTTRGSVTGIAHMGGLVGQSSGTIRRSSSTADVAARNRAGGLVGTLTTGGLVQECWASGTVTASEAGMDQGGLVGTAFGGTITDSYAVGDVTAATTAGAGGLVGGASTGVVIARSYALGEVTGSVRGAVIGHVVGEPLTTAPVACFFDVSRGVPDPLCVGLTTSQLTMAASFPMFDFTTPVWAMDPAIRSTPSLHWE